ncbi:stimulator of interferon genes protein-like isoform X2 [Branchiostoma floridae x Branchiostoma japonicum]
MVPPRNDDDITCRGDFRVGDSPNYHMRLIADDWRSDGKPQLDHKDTCGKPTKSIRDCKLSTMEQERKENNGFGSIPAPRVHRMGVFHCTLLLVVWLAFWFVIQTAWFVMQTVCSMLGLHLQPSPAALVLTTVVSELMHSVVLFVEEWKHVNSRHGSRYQAFQSCLHFEFPMRGALPALLVLSVVVISMICFLKTEILARLLSQYLDLLVLLTGVQLVILSYFMKPAEVEVMEQVEGTNQNVAHGLAWSFYTGYLKIVLPGLRERIEQSAWKDKIHPTAHRLLVLIPLKCEVRAKLEDEDSNIENVTAGLSDEGGLQPVKKDRAGIKDRVYKNDVHCITDPDDNRRKEYCVVEYATNVQTLYDMQESKACEGFSREAREQQVKLLYCTLKNIIEADGCRDRVVLVPFDITDAEDHKLARVILRTLEQLKSGTVDMPQMPDHPHLPADETVPKVAIENSDFTPMQENSEQTPKGGAPCQDSQDPPTSSSKIERGNVTFIFRQIYNSYELRQTFDCKKYLLLHFRDCKKYLLLHFRYHKEARRLCLKNQ